MNFNIGVMIAFLVSLTGTANAQTPSFDLVPVAVEIVKTDRGGSEFFWVVRVPGLNQHAENHYAYGSPETGMTLIPGNAITTFENDDSKTFKQLSIDYYEQEKALLIRRGNLFGFGQNLYADRYPEMEFIFAYDQHQHYAVGYTIRLQDQPTAEMKLRLENYRTQIKLVTAYRASGDIGKQVLAGQISEPFKNFASRFKKIQGIHSITKILDLFPLVKSVNFCSIVARGSK